MAAPLSLKPLISLHRPLVRLSILAATLFAVSGCDHGDDTKIMVYRAPKETPPPAQAAVNGAGPAEVHWAAPEGWEKQPESGFRKGSFLVHGAEGKQADVSVISFPESAGGLLANVNRWRDQLRLAALDDVSKIGAPLTVGGHELYFVDLVSEQPLLPDGSKSRILGGILALKGETWFFKMTGPDQLLESQREAFNQFLASVHTESAASAPAPMMPTAGASTNAPTSPLLETPPTAPLQYALPRNWEVKPPSQMRLASFNASAPNGKQVDISIVSLSGLAGGDLANVNRWRGQVQLAPIDEAALQQSFEHIPANGHDYRIVDMVSAGPIGEAKEKQRIVAAILDEHDRSWFIKMTGEDAAVTSQKPGFAEFLQSLKIP